MAYKDLRAFLDRLEKEGELIRIQEELDPNFEVSAIFHHLGQRENPAALIERVRGYGIPVVGNLFASEKRVALTLETTEDAFFSEYEKRLGRQIPPIAVKEAPVKEVVIREDIDIFETMPVLTYHKRDVSPYITQGVVFTKDPETGRRSMGIHRIQVKGRNKLGVFISEFGAGSSTSLKNAESRGQPLEVAIAIGVDPAILVACYSPLPLPYFDKLALVGGLRGEPLEVVSGETMDLEVPANAMFIIEGKIPPGVRELDGPFGETSGYYTPIISPVIEITAITHQREPIYAVFQPFSLDDRVFTRMVLERQLWGLLKRMIPSLKELDFSPHDDFLIMSMERKNEWEPREALYHALTLLMHVKYAIVVDEDVDVHNPMEVKWALAGRCQPDKGLVLITDVQGNPLDPSIKEGGIRSKLGIDATKPLDRAERFERVAVPEEAADKAAEVLKKYL
jgi:2,5-furandicarboxylate decarboxylase 1